MLLWENTPFPLPQPLQQESFQTQAESLYRLLFEANQHTNLTRLSSPKDFLYRHLLDSLTLLKALPLKAKIADVGSGAGFPALVLAIVGQIWELPWQITALESTQKKARFITEASEALGLKNMMVVAERAEDYGKRKGAGQFTVVTARAVASLVKLIPWCLPLLAVKGKIVAMKGRRFSEELEEAKALLSRTRTRLVKTLLYSECSELDGAVVLVLEH